MKAIRNSLRLALAIIAAQVFAISLMLGAAAMVMDEGQQLTAALDPAPSTHECVRLPDPLSMIHF